MIYLDHNATTPIHPSVAEAMHQAWLAQHANPASAHRAGRSARRLLESMRREIAEILGARTDGGRPDRVVLTSGGTEANNLALFGLAGSPPGRILVSSIEHPSVAEAADELARRGFQVHQIPVGRDGRIDLDRLDSLLQGDTRLVSVMMANNETGVLQPVDEAARLCLDRGVPLHTDAVQAVGKIPVAFGELRVAALSLSAHKFHGPRGVGALLLRSDVTLRPILFGGHQQEGLRPGSEPVELVVGLHRALQLWREEASERTARMAALRDRFEQHLRSAELGVVVNAADGPRLPHTSNVAFPGIDCQALHMALDMAAVACSVGSACASGSALPSRVLAAMNLPQEIINSSLRFSLGALTTVEQVDEAADRIVEVARRLRRLAATGNR